MKLMILDGNSIVNRAYYGVRPLNAPDGTPTNAVYGFLAILQRLLEESAPDALCVAFDLPEPTFRHRQYAGYKAQRKPMPEDLAAQMPVLKRVLEEMGVRRLEAAGWEADDILGTAAKKCAAAGWGCEIVTGDRDSFQLIGGGAAVRFVKSRMGREETALYDTARFEEEYGFAPPLMVDLKALMGDASDNIPGVPGIGEKTALDLVRRFGGIDAIYSQIDTLDIREAVRKKLAAGEESARLSYELATIRCDAPVEVEPEELRWDRDFRPGLYALFSSLGFNRFIEKWGLAPPGEDENAQEAAAAEDVGLSCGKYRAYLALKELDPSITPEQVRSMTMGELQRFIDQLTYGTQDQPVQDAGQTGENSAGNDTGTGSTSSGGTGGNGHGHCGGHGGCWQ